MNENFKPWKCLCCGMTLGIVENGNTLRIKRKDLFVTIERGKVTEICTSCGKPNTLDDENSTVTMDIKS